MRMIRPLLLAFAAGLWLRRQPLPSPFAARHDGACVALGVYFRSRLPRQSFPLRPLTNSRLATCMR